MANFTTHIAVGTVVSGGLATLTLAADVMAPEDLVAITLAGVLGSVLPDIDLKDSRPSRALFSGLAIFLSFCALFTVADRYSIPRFSKPANARTTCMKPFPSGRGVGRRMTYGPGRVYAGGRSSASRAWVCS